MKGLLTIMFTFSLIAYACMREDDTQEKMKQETLVVLNKTRSFYRGETCYEISFTNGYSRRVSFGTYSLYDKGDTTYWEYDKYSEDCFQCWYLLDKNEN
jgi:hypothetical protein